jgi:hypothetical protein
LATEMPVEFVKSIDGDGERPIHGVSPTSSLVDIGQDSKTPVSPEELKEP